MVMVGFSTNWRISTFGFHARILIFLREFHWADIELSFSKSDNFSLNIFPRSLSDPYQMFLKTMKMMMRTLIWIQKKDTIDDKGKPRVVTKHLEWMWVKMQNPICSGLYIGCTPLMTEGGRGWRLADGDQQHLTWTLANADPLARNSAVEIKQSSVEHTTLFCGFCNKIYRQCYAI